MESANRRNLRENPNETPQEPEWFAETTPENPYFFAEIFSKMAHEVKTPLSTIMGFSDVMRDSEITEEERSWYLQILGRNSGRLLEIIDDMLDLARIETGAFKTEKSPVLMKSLMGEVIDVHRFEAARKNLEFAVYASEGFPASIVSDPRRLRQILTSLMEIAVRTAPQGRIAVALFHSGGEIGVRIEHGGITVPGLGFKAIVSRYIARAIGGEVKLLQPAGGSLYLFTLRL
jgi:signal transduction histidine kinase